MGNYVRNSRRCQMCGKMTMRRRSKNCYEHRYTSTSTIDMIMYINSITLDDDMTEKELVRELYKKFGHKRDTIRKHVRNILGDIDRKGNEYET